MVTRTATAVFYMSNLQNFPFTLVWEKQNNFTKGTGMNQWAMQMHCMSHGALHGIHTRHV